MEPSTILEIRDLQHPLIRSSAANPISLRAASGDLACIVGASGSGKTTLLRILLGLLEPGEGATTLAGDAAAKVGVVFQSVDFMPWRRIIDNVRAPLPANMPRAVQRNKASEALRRAALPDVEQKYPDQLSGGMRARAALARAMVNDPGILILDEPFAALDAALGEDLNDLLVELVEHHGLTVIMVTQDLFRMLYRADRVLVLGDGPVGTNPELDLNAILGPRSKGRDPEAVAELRSRIIATMRLPQEAIAR